MALQQAETHKGISIPDGYWALHAITIDPPLNRATVRIALYYNASTWQQGNVDNALAVYPVPFAITGADFATIFDPGQTNQETLLGIFQYIKAYKEDWEETGYFENAEIVP